MTRQEYIEELKGYLKDIEATDQKDVLAYVEEYFFEAGNEHETEVIKELGTPKEFVEQLQGVLQARNDGSVSNEIRPSLKEEIQANYRNQSHSDKDITKTISIVAVVIGVLLSLGVIATSLIGISYLVYFMFQDIDKATMIWYVGSSLLIVGICLLAIALIYTLITKFFKTKDNKIEEKGDQ